MTSFRPIRLSKIEPFRASEYVNPSVNSTFRIQRSTENTIHLPKPIPDDPSTYFQMPPSGSNIMTSIIEEEEAPLPVFSPPQSITNDIKPPTTPVKKTFPNSISMLQKLVRLRSSNIQHET